MKSKFLALILFCLISGVSVAQALKTWTWTDYRMLFKAPNDFKIDENNSTKFSGGNGKLYLTIYPTKGTKMAYDDMKQALRDWSRKNDISHSKDVQYMSDLNGYWGVYIDGTANNGLPTSILLLVDPNDTSITFYVWLQYQSAYLDTAVDILKSFVPQ